MFEITGRAAAGRLGRFRTPHGDVRTPTLMPVINPNIDLVTPAEMRDKFGCEMVITNSYVTHKYEHLRDAALERGIHDLIGWDGALMTDSGTFQMYVYGDVDVGPDEIVAFQRDIGVDVATCLDHFVTPDMTREDAEAAVKTTLERTATAVPVAHQTEAQGARRGPAMVNATIQGGLFGDLRQACAAAYRELDVEYHTIGGVVPVMERQMYPELVDIILHSQQHMRKDRPVHLFGAGHPLVFPLATALGCDLYDSSSYAKYAKDGRVMTPEGTLHASDLEEWPTEARFLAPWTPAEFTKALKEKRRRRVDGDRPASQQQSRIKELEADPGFAAERALALHNLDVQFTDLRRIRQAMRDGVLWELVEQRAACHPMLAAATRRLGRPDAQAWLESREPNSGHKALRYTGSLTHRRPLFRRIRTRLQDRTTMIGPSIEAAMDTPYAQAGDEKREVAMHKEPQTKPFGDALGDGFDPEQDHVVISALGPTPVGLDECYPFSQSVLPRLDGLDPEHMAWVGDTKDAFLAAHDLMPGIPGPPGPAGRLDRDFLQVYRTADWQFGAGAGLALTGAALPHDVHQALATSDASRTTSTRQSDGPPRDGTTSGSPWQDADAATRAETEDQAPAAAEPSALRALSEGATRADSFEAQRSKATQKMRTAYLGGEHTLSLRAGDARFTLKPAGARLLHAALPAPRMRVVVHPDSVPFNRDGKSVFNQFVLDCDRALRPGDECLVVDPDDNLVAVGQVLLVADEMADFQRSMAVKVRDGIPIS